VLQRRSKLEQFLGNLECREPIISGKGAAGESMQLEQSAVSV